MIFLRLFSGYLIQVAPFAVLCFYPTVKHFRYPLRRTVLLTGGVILFLAGCFASAGCILEAAMPRGPRLFEAVNAVFMVSLIPCCLTYFLLVKTNWQKKLFVFCFSLTAALTVTYIGNLLVHWFGTGSNDWLPYQSQTPFFLFAVNAAALPPLLLLLRFCYVPVEEGLAPKDFGYLSILSLILFLLLSSWFQHTAYLDLRTDYAMLFLLGALLVAVFAIYAICFRLIGSTSARQEEQRRFAEIRHQMELQETQHRRFLETIDVDRRQRHDFRHHMAVVRGFLKEGETREAEDYLDGVSPSFDEYEIVRYCGSAVVNLLVSYYVAAAREKEIELTARIAIPAELSVEDTDLSVLLGNLLENAVEGASRAAEGDRFIRLNIVCRGRMMAVTVDNGFDGLVRREEGRFLSTKEGHTGLGLRSVERIAEKYGGGVDFACEGTVFRSSVMLAL